MFSLASLCRNSIGFILLSAIFVAYADAAPVPELPARGRTHFEIADYFLVRRVEEMALSSNGHWLAYKIRHASLDENRRVTEVHVQDLRTERSARIIPELSDATNLQWLPQSNKLAFLKSAQSSSGNDDAPLDLTQVHTFDCSSNRVDQVTHASSHVVAFGYTRTGLLFYQTQGTSRPNSVQSELRAARTGVLVDLSVARREHFVGDFSAVEEEFGPSSLWVFSHVNGTSRLPVTAEVLDFSWSEDGDLLAITFVAEELRARSPIQPLTSVGLLDLATGQVRTILAARWDEKSFRSYSSPKFAPHSNKIVVQRISDSHPWLGTLNPEIGVVPIASVVDPELGVQWHVVPFFSTIFVRNAEEVYVEAKVRARHGLFRLGCEEFRLKKQEVGFQGSSSRFAFSNDFSTLAFVHESLNEPPEIYVRRGESEPQRISNLNGYARSRSMPTVAEVSWRATDGTLITGWLLTPSDHSSRSWPLLTYVHGGPGWAYPDAFLPLFDFAWPYPLEVYPSHGIAVFVPNYRGTATFGRDFQTVTSNDYEPPDDIISGIHHLVQQGVADPERLAIAGHSHGAWLAPIVMTQAPIFRAAMFAEIGYSDAISMYMNTSGNLNSRVHDVVFGSSPFENPQRYLELSPSLRLTQSNAAVLLESGALDGSPLGMMGLAKAITHAGAPTEFYVYPRTSHVILEPVLQRESAQLNLDWVNYWLMGRLERQASDPTRYQRWTSLATHRVMTTVQDCLELGVKCSGPDYYSVPGSVRLKAKNYIAVWANSYWTCASPETQNE